MTKSNKQIIIILAVTATIIAAIVIAYFVMRKKSSAKIVPIGEVGDQEDTVGVTTLQYGSRGSEVKRLQVFLNQQLSLLIWKGLPTLNGKQIKDLERPSSTRLEARFPYHDSRAMTRSLSPLVWRPDFPGALERLTDLAVVPREKPHTVAAAREQP